MMQKHEELRASQQSNSEKERYINGMKAEIAAKDEKNLEQRKRIDDLNEQLKDERAMNSTAQVKLENLEAELRSRNAEETKLHKRLEQMASDNSSLKKATEALQAETDKAKQGIKEKDAQIQASKSETEYKNRDLNKLKDRIAKMENEHRDEKSEWTRSTSQKLQQHQDFLAQQHQQAVAQALEKQRFDYEKHITELSTQNQRLQDQCLRAGQWEAEATDQRKQIASLQQDLQKTILKTKELTKENVHYNSQHREALQNSRMTSGDVRKLLEANQESDRLRHLEQQNKQLEWDIEQHKRQRQVMWKFLDDGLDERKMKELERAIEATQK
jgi:hypothetical protein